MTPEQPDIVPPTSTPTGVSANDLGKLPPTPASQPPCSNPSWTGYGWALLACVTLFGALHWWWYLNAGDRHNHMAVIQGLHQVGGLPAAGQWEIAPAGQTSFPTPALHVLGYLVSFAGVSPGAFLTFLSCLLWPASLLATWLWMRQVFGARVALAALILLSGSHAFFWNQTTFNAYGLVMMLAPLALLALESERFLACGVLNLLALTAHPMAIFLPPALVTTTLLRPASRLPGFLAAGLPMLLCSPWLAPIWANQAYLPEKLAGIGSSLNLGVAITLAAGLGLCCLMVRRREVQGLLGLLLGFAVVVALGFGGHFLQYTIHWPLACLGGYGLGRFLEWLECKLPRGVPAVRIASAILAFLVLTTWAEVEVQLPKRAGETGKTGAPGTATAFASPGGPVKPGKWRARDSQPPAKAVPEGAQPPVRFAMGMSLLANLLDPNGWIPTMGGGSGRPEETDWLQRKGADEFLEAIKAQVAPEEIIYLSDGPAARFVTGSTGRWTTGVLREVRPADAPLRIERCHFHVIISGRPFGNTKFTRTFTRVFGNTFGTLYRNKIALPGIAPVKPAVPTLSLVVLALLGIGLVWFDLRLPRERLRARLLPASLAVALVTFHVSRFTSHSSPSAFDAPTAEVEALLTEVQQAGARYFWDYAHPVSGLAREGSDRDPDLCAIGASGMGFFNLIVAVERGFVPRAQAAERLRTTLRFLAEKTERFHGVFPHWINGATGMTIPFSRDDDGADLVETAFLAQGLLALREYFQATNPVEDEIRRRADQLWRDMEWDWFAKPMGHNSSLFWHWSAKYGWRKNLPIRGFNECHIVYLLALASPTHAVAPKFYWEGWHNPRFPSQPSRISLQNYSSPLFWTHYSYLGFDPRSLSWNGKTYFDHFRDLGRAQVDYSWSRADTFKGYGLVWGLTACLGPDGYAAFAPGPRDNGTLAPTAALSSLPYVPEESIACLLELQRQYRSQLWGPYGFRDAFNPTRHWFAPGYLGNNVGPIAPMIENHRSGLCWKVFMKAPEISAALKQLRDSDPQRGF